MRYGIIALIGLVALGAASCGIMRPADCPVNTDKKNGAIGVVLLHGKRSSPDGPLLPLAAELQNTGFLVTTPLMPWQKNYTASFEESLKIIDQAVEKLRSCGAEFVFVGGQNLGANAAIAYATEFSPPDGVMVISPGHIPDIPVFADNLGSSVVRSRKLVQRGQENREIELLDINQNAVYKIIQTPRIYLSYFNPEGLAAMSKTIPRLPSATPLLWVVGSQDRLSRNGRAYFFDKAPENPLNSYVIVRGGHDQTPDVSREKITGWIKNVVAKKK